MRGRLGHVDIDAVGALDGGQRIGLTGLNQCARRQQRTADTARNRRADAGEILVHLRCLHRALLRRNENSRAEGSGAALDRVGTAENVVDGLLRILAFLQCEQPALDHVETVVALGDEDLADLGHAFVGRVGVVDFIAINEQNQIGILFDCTGLSQVRHHRPLVRPLLQ